MSPFEPHPEPCRFPTNPHCSCEQPSFVLHLPSEPPEEVPPLTPEREAEIRGSVPTGYTDWSYAPDVDAGGILRGWEVRYDTPHPQAGLIATVPDYGEGLADFIAGARDAVPQLLAEVDRLRAALALGATREVAQQTADYLGALQESLPRLLGEHRGSVLREAADLLQEWPGDQTPEEERPGYDGPVLDTHDDIYHALRCGEAETSEGADALIGDHRLLVLGEVAAELRRMADASRGGAS